MIDRAAKAINAFPEKFGEAWLSCMLLMSQGDISGLTWKHAKVAYNTGIGTAVTYAVCCLLFRRITPFNSIVLTGVLTFFADLVGHSTHYGHFYSEALHTGLTASVFALLFHIFAGKIQVNKKSNDKS